MRIVVLAGGGGCARNLDTVMDTPDGGDDPRRHRGRARESWVVREVAAPDSAAGWSGTGGRDVATHRGVPEVDRFVFGGAATATAVTVAAAAALAGR